MNKDLIKKIVPHLLAFFVLLAVSIAFFAPIVFEGKTLAQSDNVRAISTQTEFTKVFNETGKAPLWTNSQFGGMPAYQIQTVVNGNFTKPLFYWLNLKQPITDAYNVIFLAMLCCYFMLICLRIDWRLAIAGAIAYGLSSYNLDITEAGHSTKLVAMAHAPAIFAGMLLIYRGKYVLGMGIVALFLNFQIFTNHLQITYYTALLMGVFVLVQFVGAFKEKTWTDFAKATLALAFAAALGALCNTSKLLPTYEYSKETIRGKSQLSANAAKGDGLDYDYATRWSYGIFESFTTLAQNIQGGGASQSAKGTKTYSNLYQGIKGDLMQRNGMSQEEASKAANQQIASTFYWGDQPFVGVAIYFGAICWFLFLLGAFLVKGREKYWLIAATMVVFFIAWGKNSPVHHLLFNYFPMFNKFRAVSMILGFGQLTFVMLGILGLQRFFDKNIAASEKNKALLYAAGGTLGLCLLLLVASAVVSYAGANDGNLQNILSIVKADRASMFRSDVFRSFMLILLSAGLLWAYLQGKIKSTIAVLGVCVLMFGDTWLIGKRILFAEKFEAKKSIMGDVKPLPVDEKILADKDIHYRVLDVLRGDPFTNATTSSFHKSIGGYHAAKLSLIQEMIERYLSKPNESMHLFGMLNVKYIIQDANNPTLNPQALGNAWFVKELAFVPNADAELDALATLKPKEKAVIQEQFAGDLKTFKIQPDTTASIKLTAYNPDKMVYESNANSEQIAVFSEVYYPPAKGWKTYIDGNLAADFTKANYLLRAMKVPAGKHTIEMRFEPKSFYLGENIARVASILTLLLFVGGFVLLLRKRALPSVSLLEEIEKETLPQVQATVRKESKKK